jgi:hypothetical protein
MPKTKLILTEKEWDKFFSLMEEIVEFDWANRSINVNDIVEQKAKEHNQIPALDHFLSMF